MLSKPIQIDNAKTTLLFRLFSETVVFDIKLFNIN